MPPLAARLVLGAAAGFAAGVVFFATLEPVSRLLLRTRGAALAVPLQLARMLGLALVLAGIARLGPGGLLAAAGGILVGRTLVLRRARRGATGG